MSITTSFTREGTPISTSGNSYSIVASDQGSIISCTATPSLTGISYTAFPDPVMGPTIRYVSNSLGVDTNNGLTQATPWKTIAKVSSPNTFSSGTSILLKRGDRWDRSAGPTLNNLLNLASAGTSGHPINYAAYGNGPNPIIDGSADASVQSTSWQSTGTTNVWQSVQTFTPIGGAGTNGLPFFHANDVGNILWGFSPLGGSAPFAVNTASFGQMVGAGTGGVWYSPGENQTTLAANAVPGQWNFNTDTFKAQIYSTSDPAVAFPGIRLVMDGGGFSISSAAPFTIIQNITFQYIGASSSALISASNSIVRDCVFQWIGGGNLGGGSGANSRAGDAMNPEGTYTNILIERNYFYQMYDVGISPQQSTNGAHDNLTIRNNIFHHFGTSFGIGVNPPGASTENGLYIYNNTSYGVDSWSANQRPNGFPVVWGIHLGNNSHVTNTNLQVENNAFGAINQFTAFFTSPTDRTLSNQVPLIWDYNSWSSLGGTSEIGDSSGNITMASWKSTYGFELHGLIDVAQGFTDPTNANFTPAGGSALRSAGTNLYSVGVVWDFNKQPRPSTGPFTIGAIQ